MKDTKPLLIALLSIGLVGTWIYHLVDKTRYSEMRTEVFVKDSAAIADAVKDSLRKMYSDTIHAMDNRLASSENNINSLANDNSALKVELDKMNALKKQINSILRDNNSNEKDLTKARNMIQELQQSVDDLNSSNNSIAQEKDRMNLQMQQLTVQIDELQKNVQTLSTENVVLSEQIKMASLFVASQITISAMYNRGKKEEETSDANRADKLYASFTVQNLTYEYSPAEVIVIVYEPNGQVLQNSDWDVESVEAKNQGTQIQSNTRKFTRRVKFDYPKGEQKHVFFTLHADKFQSGTYKFELWHKGILIGTATTVLS